MKLLYATSITFPSPLANRLQIAQMAEAFAARLGENFLLGIGRGDPAAPIRAAVIETGEGVPSYRLALRYARLAARGGFTHVFTREPALLFFLTLLRPIFRARFSLAFELHHLEPLATGWFRFALRRAARVVVITEGLRQGLRARGLPWRNVLVAPDAVDFAKFDIPLGKAEARRELVLPADRKIVLYAGSLEPWKGVGLLYEAAKSFGGDWLFLVVGARQSHVDEFLETHPETENFKLLGYRPHGEIPRFMKAADVAVLPNTGGSSISRVSTSPMKLFEYMAARLPIVAARLPSTEEALSGPEGDRGEYFAADDANDLARAIRAVGEAVASGRPVPAVERAYVAARENTWGNRAARVIEFLA